MTGPDPDSPRSGWRVGLCEKPADLYGAADFGRMNFSKRKCEKRHSQRLFRNSPAATVPSSALLTLPSPLVLPWWHGRPCAHTRRPRESAHPNLRDQQLPDLPLPQAWDRAPLTPPPRGTKYPTPAPLGKQHRRHAPASTAAAGPTGSLRGKLTHPCRGELQCSGSQQSPERFNPVGRLN